jgi:hypothetical protein
LYVLALCFCKPGNARVLMSYRITLDQWTMKSKIQWIFIPFRRKNVRNILQKLPSTSGKPGGKFIVSVESST